MLEPKLVTITRKDISPGYHVVQTAHSVAQFALDHPSIFTEWDQNSKSIICLEIKDEFKLSNLATFMEQEFNLDVTRFHEPDINDEMTSICFYAHHDERMFLKKYSLSLRSLNV